MTGRFWRFFAAEQMSQVNTERTVVTFRLKCLLTRGLIYLTTRVMAYRGVFMTRCLVIYLIVIAASFAAGCTSGKPLSETAEPCNASWERFIEDNVSTGDGLGHGPDVGSDEWKSVVEFKLGIRDDPSVPEWSSPAWCYHIDQIVNKSRASYAGSESGPSFSCDNIEGSSIEAMICGDDELSALDRKLSGIYAIATRQAADEQPSSLKAEQRGWIKGRNECWKSDDKRACVMNEYILRQAELQARYRMVTYSGPVKFICDGNPVNEIIVMFFQTDPQTLIAERGDSVSIMYIQPSASGSKYKGRNETFWTKHNEALVTWGYDVAEMRCKIAS